MEKESINYYLVLEKRRGDHVLIDINKLDICHFQVVNTLESIDGFSKMFSEQEIKDSIQRSNMADKAYLDGTLKIISNIGHNLEIVTKTVLNNVIEFQYGDGEINKDFKNKIYSFYKKIIDNNFDDPDFIKGILERFKGALRDNNRAYICQLIEELPYQKIRPLYINISKEIQKNKMVRIKKLEKLNDVA